MDYISQMHPRSSRGRVVRNDRRGSANINLQIKSQEGNEGRFLQQNDHIAIEISHAAEKPDHEPLRCLPPARSKSGFVETRSFEALPAKHERKSRRIEASFNESPAQSAEQCPVSELS